ncbi:MAG: DoxX family protein [bacterium]
MYKVYSIFPELFTYSFLVPLILRLALGLIFINLGYLKLAKEKNGWLMLLRFLKIPQAKFWLSIFGILEILGGVMLIVGLYVQGVALFFTIIGLISFAVESREESLLRRDFVFYFLTLAITICLLVSGAGMMAFDAPL